MELITKDVEILIEKEEKASCLSEIQLAMEDAGTISRTPFLLSRRLKGLLKYTGVLCIGIVTGTFVILLNFIIFVYFLHLEL